MRHTSVLTVTALVVLGAGSPGLAEEQSLSQLYEKAVYTENTAGNLDEAIALYEKVIAMAEANRVTSAKAHLRRGMCLAKKGERAQAIEEFETVRNQYSDQKGVSDAAARELIKLRGKGGGGAAPAAMGKGGTPGPAIVFASPAPKVVSTTPAAFDDKVSPALKELTVTFSMPMQDQSWSWTGGGETYPKLTAKPSYDADRKTCKLPVALDAGKVYWVGINSPSHRNFKSPSGTPAQRYVILFATADAEGKATPIPADLLERAKEINTRKESDAVAPTAAATQPEGRRGLLDPATLADVEKFEQMFAAWFKTDEAYEAASPSERAAMIEQWMTEAKGNDFDRRTRAIAQLGNVRAKEALDLLIEIAEQPMNNNRPKWMAVRGLGRIGEPAAVPTLIDLVDYGNVNTKVYARASLVDITGVYFGEDKAKWREWWKTRETRVTPAQKREAEAISMRAWKLWQTQKPEQAEPLFRQATAKDPGNANAWNGLGWSQFNQGKAAAARVSFERAVQVEPKHTGALNGLGFIAKGEGNIDEAIGNWKKAVESFPGASAPLAGLANTYLETGKPQDAIKYFEMWLKAEPGSADAKAGLEKARAAANSKE